MSALGRLLREPLVHFVLIGVALFAASQLVQPARPATAASKEIALSLDELTQIALQFESQWRRPPTPDELTRLIEDRVQEEVLYREALAMGLDKNDMIVKRRLAQKLQFLAEDVASAREPSGDELRSWYAQNRASFAQPPRVSFRHLYFSPDRRGERAHDDAASALAKLAGQREDSALVGTLGDPFMFQDYYRERAPDQLAKDFGPAFAEAVASLPAGSWQGPLESGFGWHLVFVDTRVPGREPEFEEVEPDVKAAWLTEQKARAWKEAYDEMRAKYTVLLPAPPEAASRPPQAPNVPSPAPIASPD